MSTRTLVLCCLLITALLITGLAEAQQPKKVFRVGYLTRTTAALDSDRKEGIRLALREFSLGSILLRLVS
jgi:hypothetical protein